MGTWYVKVGSILGMFADSKRGQCGSSRINWKTIIGDKIIRIGGKGEGQIMKDFGGHCYTGFYTE